MPIVDVPLLEESQTRYLTYALSVVSSRALPDVRDGLKPVQRRILYAMANNLSLLPDRTHRKSAAVVGEVLARFHPHGDAACYDAMVRMAQDFNFRYPLVDGQGNFGSLDGDSPAAYRYTEAKLTPLALEVIGDIGQDTVQERDNFDQTTKEPVVLPSRVPNLLINGASGIAVGMATAIPPHNLSEVTKALLLMLEDAEATDSKLLSVIKGPDFPTACEILNTKAELKEIYTTGRGAIRMRANYRVEETGRKKHSVVVKSIPYAVDKSQLVERIADLIIGRKVPQLVDVRDESTDEVRIVMELAPEADAEKAMTYLYKHTPLQQNFNVNLTALVPSSNPYSGRPLLLSLRQMLQHFIDFRVQVTRAKLAYERTKLEQRIHLLEGLVLIFDALDEAIGIVRKSEGRSDAAGKLQQRFKLTEEQSFFIVDLRIYQLSRTSVDDITAELTEKQKRVAEINRILKSDAKVKEVIADDLRRIAAEFGDSRRCAVVHEFEEPEFIKDEYVQHEDCLVIVTKDGWLKRLRPTNDPLSTRIREGDSLFFAKFGSTRDSLALFSNLGNVYVTRVLDLTATSGFGEPVQKLFKFQDEERVSACLLIKRDEEGISALKEILVFSSRGLGMRLSGDLLTDTKRTGKRLMKLEGVDVVAGALEVDKPMIFLVSRQGYGLCMMATEVPVLGGAAKGVILKRVGADDRLVGGASVKKDNKVEIVLERGTTREIDMKSLTIGGRAQKGNKVVERGGPVAGLQPVIDRPSP